MLDFGSSDNHSNALDFGDLDYIDGDVYYAVGMWLVENAAATSSYVFCDGRLTTGTDPGFALLRAGTNFRIRHGDGGTVSNVDFAATMTGTHAIFYVWGNFSGGSKIRFYFDGVLVSETAFTRGRAVNPRPFIIGGSSDTNPNDGYACDMGQFMYWHDVDWSTSKADLAAAIFYAHQNVPFPSELTFWHKGLATPGLDEVTQAIPTARTTVGISANDVDTYYRAKANQAVRVASHRLLRRSSEEPRYTVRLPLGFINCEPMDLMNLSHPELPLSASRFAIKNEDENQLAEPWRRLAVRATSKEVRHLERQIVFESKDHELFGLTHWSSDRLPGGTNARFEGLARVDNGADFVVERSSPGYLEQPSTLVVEVAQELEGNFIKTAEIGQEKMNHVGFLAEDATENFILNGTAVDDEAGWTSVANSGTLDRSTLRLFYPSRVTSQSFRALRSDDASDTYRHQTFSMLTANAYARIYALLAEQNADSIASVQVQRSTDSFYWNDATEAWQSGAVWVNFANAYDATRGVPVKHREYTKPIPIEQDEDWTVKFGVEGASLPAGGGEVNFGSVSCLKGRLVYSEVPTNQTSMVYTPIADTVYFERTSLPQVFPSSRGSITFEMVAVQDGDYYTDDDEHVLFYWEAARGAAQDYDVVLIQKLSGETLRISHVRYIGGILDARAYCEVTLTPGETYKVQVVWTDGNGLDLAEAAYLMRVLVNGVAGVDAHASATHSAAATTTQVWKGCAPDATGYRRAMNYLRNLKFPTRPLPNEEATA